MSIEVTHDRALTPAEPAGPLIHPFWVRLTHWVNAIAMVLMISSGWEIYNASPLFPFVFPPAITLGGWLAGALLWHFAAMWLLAVNGLVYVVVGCVVAAQHDFFDHLRTVDGIVSAALAVVLWPLVLLGVHARI